MAKTLLIIIVDLFPQTVLALLDQIKVFMEAHVLLRPYNKILLISTYGNEAAFVYPKSENTRLYSKGDMLEAIQNLRDNLVESNCKKNGSIGAALTLGVCFANRWLNKHKSNDFIDTNNNNIRNNEDASISNRRARILILTESMKKDHVEIDPKAKEYRAVMNCAFSAEKLNILIDCFNVSPLSSTTLFTESEMSKMQQACYVSNGLYWSRSIDAEHKDQIKDEKPNVEINNKNDSSSSDDDIKAYFLPTLIFYFLPGHDCRQKLRQPPRTSVKLNASCFETGISVEKGYLCSICLSVTSEKKKSCITCNSPYENDSSFLKAKRIKKKKVVVRKT
jgi:hypothetical protein